MQTRPPHRRRPGLGRVLPLWPALLAVLAGLVLAAPGTASAASATTAWRGGAFHLDPEAVVSRSDIVLGAPGLTGSASMPLGNGSLGVAAWAENGFTAQLNRSDTMPDRKSPGQLAIPGLSVITHAPDFSGRLDLTDGVLRESGGGMSLKAWVATDKDELVVDVSGADPRIPQTATVSLWNGRSPAAAVQGTTATLAETWKDSDPAIGSGRTFGSLAALTAGGRDVRVGVASPTQVKASFTPHADGTFRVVVASPAWTGGDAAKKARKVIGNDASTAATKLMSRQNAWWKGFWKTSGLVTMDSADGSAAYIENLRTLYLYEEAASMKKGIYPGSQAGEADMFAWDKDTQTWTPSAYWLWNLRTQIAANMSSGNYDLNTPIFDMYAEDVPGIEAWTKLAMGGRPGSCVPETMRFNGNGLDVATGNCSEASSPNWNALDISSGPEVALYMWEQYEATGDRAMLRTYWPFIKSTVRFQLAYQKVGADGLLHANANAHETQWAVQDPTTDIAVDKAVFPVVVAAAKALGTDLTGDAGLVRQVKKAETQIPPYPRTDDATRTQLLNPHYTQAETDAADATGTDMVGISYEPAAQRQNGENIELEPLWPWNTVSDQDTGLFALEQRSYDHRPNKGGNDWSMDAIDAARLQRPDEVRADLVSITEGHQVYPNGFADLGNTVGYQPYIEQEAGVATAVDEALAQDYDGIIRFAPAWPSDWNGAGSVHIQHKDTVDVQVHDGQLTTAAIEAGTTGTLKVKNPWPGHQVTVVDGDSGRTVVRPTGSALLSVPVRAGSSYLVEQAAAPTTKAPYAAVGGTAPDTARHLGPVQIGLDPDTSRGTSTVGTVLGASDASFGLTRIDDPSDPAPAGTVAGRTARTAGTGTGPASMAFDVDNAVAATGSYSGTVSVSYYDAGTGSLTLRYDAGPGKTDRVAGTIHLGGTDTWRSADLPLTGAYFGGLGEGGADLSLQGTAPFSVHSAALAVTGARVPDRQEFPPAPAITSPKSGATVPLSSPVSGTAIPDGAVAVLNGTSPCARRPPTPRAPGAVPRTAGSQRGGRASPSPSPTRQVSPAPPRWPPASPPPTGPRAPTSSAPYWAPRTTRTA